MAKNTVRVHNDIPWNKVQKMWDGGASYEKMAKAIDRFNPKQDDPTKPMRAIISRGLTNGFNVDGKLIKLSPREGMRAIGVGKKAPKAKVAAKKLAKVVKTKAVGKSKAVVIALDSNGKLVRISMPKPKALVPIGNIVPSLVDILGKLGYSVAKTEKVDTPATETTLPTDMPTAPAHSDEGTATPEVTASASNLPTVTKNDVPVQNETAA